MRKAPCELKERVHVRLPLRVEDYRYPRVRDQRARDSTLSSD